MSDNSFNVCKDCGNLLPNRERLFCNNDCKLNYEETIQKFSTWPNPLADVPINTQKRIELQYQSLYKSLRNK